MSNTKEKLLHRIPTPFLPLGLIQFINRFEKLVLYGIIGGGAVIVDVGLFWILARDSDGNIATIIKNGLAILAAMIYSFTLNAYLNFKTTDGLLKRFISFAFVTSCGFVISSVMLWFMSSVLGMDRLLVKNLTLPVVFIVQFTLNSKFTFKEAAASEDIALESIS